MGHDSCPLCDSSSTVLVKQIGIPELVVCWSKTLQIDISGELAGTQHIQLFACSRCGLEFYSPSSLAGSSELYSQLQKHSWYYTPRKWEHDVAIRDLADSEASLEIGCGAGEFIARARSEKNVEVHGIETNKNAAHKAQDLGLSVEIMELGAAAMRWPGRYDAVYAFQVLEHVPNPKEFLNWSCALLKSGGRLVLGLPNAESFLRYQFDPLDMPPHHMTKWNHRVLQYLPHLFPLRLIQIRREPLAEYHVREYLKAYCRLYASRGIPKIFYPRWLQRKLRKLLKVRGVRSFLVGHTLYAKFQRT
jgi:SAM-dependent methyltransferase